MYAFKCKVLQGDKLEVIPVEVRVSLCVGQWTFLGLVMFVLVCGWKRLRFSCCNCVVIALFQAVVLDLCNDMKYQNPDINTIDR